MRAKIFRGATAEPLSWLSLPGVPTVRGPEPVEGIVWGLAFPPPPEPEPEPPPPAPPPEPAPPPAPPEPAVDWRGEADALRAELASVQAGIPAQLQRARKEGHDSGFGEGVRQGEAASRDAAHEAARAEYEQALANAAQSVRDILESRGRMRQQMEEDLVHLAVAVARRILHRELHVDPEALTGIVKAAIGRIDARELHRITVAPYDATFVKKHLDSFRLPERVEIGADGSLPRGSVVFETARGHVDASVETQLQEIDRGFADLVRRS